MWDSDGADSFSVDHFEPQSRRKDLACTYSNLRYACLECNSNRRDSVVLDPCVAPLGGLLRVTAAGAIEPRPVLASRAASVPGVSAWEDSGR